MRWAPIIGLILIGQVGLGAEKPVVDYSKALDELGKLGGLVEMKGAKWVAQSGEDGSAEDTGMPYEIERGIEGHGWKIPGQDELLAFGMMTARGAAAASQAQGESLAKADTEALVGLLTDPEQSHGMRLEYGSSEVVGRSLLFAVQLRAAGETALANELAGALFNLTVDKALVVDAAVTQLADAEFQRAGEKFFSDYNWGGYAGELKRLRGKYPRGWKDGPAVGLLIARLEQRAAGAAPPKPALPGLELKPAALDALQRLLSVPAKPELSDEQLAKRFEVDLEEIPAGQRAALLARMRSHLRDLGSESSEGLWLLEEADSEPGERSALDELKAMKMDGLLALAAVATDETLVPIPKSTNDSYSSDESDDPQERYMALRRPQSRGELAVELLKAALPGDYDEADAEELRDAAIAFWRKHHKSGPIALATAYLTEGQGYQVQLAASYLAESEDPAAHAAFEKAVLAADNVTIFLNDVNRYLSARGPAAAEFFRAFAKMVRETTAGADATDEYEARQAQQMEQMLVAMGVKVGSVSLPELIDAALKAPAAGEGPENGSMSPILGLTNALGNVPTGECLKTFAAKMGAATPQQLMEIHYLLINKVADFNDEEGSQAEPLAKEILELWRPMTTDQRKLPEGNLTERLQSLGCETLGDSASIVVELAAFPAGLRSLQQINAVSGSPAAAMAILRGRVEALVSGKEPAPWPAAANVSAQRTKELESELGGLKAAEIGGYVARLKLDEQLALAEIMANYDEDHPAPAGVQEIRKQVTSTATQFDWLPNDPELLQKAGIGIGFVVSAESIEGLIAKLAGEAKQFSKVALVFKPAPLGLGSVANAARLDDPKSPGFQRLGIGELAAESANNPDAEALVALQVMQFPIVWLVRNGKPEPTPQAERLMKQLKRPDAPLSEQPFLLQVLTREDAEKLNQ